MGLVIGLPAFFQYFNINLDDTQGNQITGGGEVRWRFKSCLLTRPSYQWTIFWRRHLRLYLCAMASGPLRPTSDHPDSGGVGYHLGSIAGRQCPYCTQSALCVSESTLTLLAGHVLNFSLSQRLCCGYAGHFYSRLSIRDLACTPARTHGRCSWCTYRDRVLCSRLRWVRHIFCCSHRKLATLPQSADRGSTSSLRWVSMVRRPFHPSGFWYITID